MKLATVLTVTGTFGKAVISIKTDSGASTSRFGLSGEEAKKEHAGLVEGIHNAMSKAGCYPQNIQVK